MTVVSLEAARTALAQVVVGREDFCYTEGRNEQDKCNYTADDRSIRGPGCIVGTALFALGVPYEVLMEMDQAGDSMITDEDVLSILRENDFVLGQGVVRYFGDAQWEQDRGSTWGEALTMTERILNS